MTRFQDAPERAAEARPLRVLQVLGHAREGGRASGITGVEKVVQVLLQGLPPARFEHYLAYSPSGALLETMRPYCRNILEIEPRKRHDPDYVAALGRFIRTHGIDLVVSHGTRYDWHAALASRRAQVPHLVVRAVALADERMPRLRKLAYGFFDAWTLNTCTAIVAVSRASRRRMLRTQLLPPAKIAVIPNGVAVPRVSPAERAAARLALGVDASARLVGGIGQLIPRKSFDVLVRALGRVRERQPNVVGVVLGEGPERERLASLAKALQVSLLLPGFVPNPHPAIAAFDIAVLPSRAEGMPLVVLESMALGVPTIATAVAGTPEILRDEVTGGLVPPGDEVALAAILSRWLADDALRARLGAAGERHVAAHFTLDAMLAAFGTTFERVARGPR